MDDYAKSAPPAYELPGVSTKVDVEWASPPKTLVVLVHGLSGPDPIDRPLWAWDWLPSDNNVSAFIPYKFSPVDILSDDAPPNALEREARNLLEVMNSDALQLNNIPVPQKLNDKKPIVDLTSPIQPHLYAFKAHGIGGTIVKKALVISYKELLYRNVLDETHALMLFGTPCRGTPTRSLDSIIIDMILENYPGFLSAECMSKAVNRLSREVERIEADFSSINHPFDTITCCQPSVSTNSSWRSIVTEDSAKLGLENELVVTSDQRLRDLGRIINRQESARLRLHMANSSARNWAVTRRCLNMLTSARPQGPSENGWLWSHPWFPPITEQCVNSAVLKHWISATTKDRTFLRVVNTHASGFAALAEIRPGAVLNSIARAMAMDPHVTWLEAPPAEQALQGLADKHMTDVAKQTSLCARLLFQLIYQQPRAFLYMQHLLPNLVDALQGNLEAWKERAVWQCLRAVLHAPLGVSLYGFLSLDSSPVGSSFLKRIESTIKGTDSRVRLVVIFDDGIARSLRDAGIPYATLSLDLKAVSSTNNPFFSPLAVPRSPRGATAEIRSRLLLATLEALPGRTAQLAFASLVAIAFADSPMTSDELEGVLAFHDIATAETYAGSVPDASFQRGFAANVMELLAGFVAISRERLFLTTSSADIQDFVSAHAGDFLGTGLSPHLYLGRVCISAVLYFATRLDSTNHFGSLRNKTWRVSSQGGVIKELNESSAMGGPGEDIAVDATSPPSPTSSLDSKAHRGIEQSSTGNEDEGDWGQSAVGLLSYAADRWLKHYRLAGFDTNKNAEKDPFFAAFVADERHIEEWLGLCNSLHPLPLCRAAEPEHAVSLSTSDKLLKQFLNPRNLRDLEILHCLAVRPSEISGVGRLLVYAAEMLDYNLVRSIFSSSEAMQTVERKAVLRALASLPHGPEFNLLSARVYEDDEATPESLETASRICLAAQVIGNHELAAALLRDNLLESSVRSTREWTLWSSEALQQAIEYGNDKDVDMVSQYYHPAEARMETEKESVTDGSENKQDGGTKGKEDTSCWTPLHRLATTGASCPIIPPKTLHCLRSPGSIDAYAPNQQTPLFIASVFGQASVVEYLLSSGNEASINYRNTPLRRAALHAASYHGHVKTTRVLLDHNAEVAIWDLQGNFPLHLAIQQGHVEVAEMLAKATDSRASTASIIVTAGQPRRHRPGSFGSDLSAAPSVGVGNEGQKELVAYHDNATNAENNGTEGTMILVQNFKTETATQGVDSDDDYDAVEFSGSEYEYTSSICSPVNTANEDGANVFFMAVDKDLGSVANLLLDRAADPNIMDYRKIVAIHMAARAGAVDTIQRLIAKGALLNPNEGEDSLKPIHYACYRGHAGAATALASSDQCDLLAEDRWGRTALAAASAAGHLSVVEALHDRYLDNPASRVEALVAAAENGHLRVASYLLERGCPIDDTSPNMHDLDNSGNENNQNFNALHTAVAAAQPRMVRLLLLHGASPTVTATKGIQPLHIACRVGILDSVKLLADMGAPLEAEMDTGDTPLLHAIASSHARVVEYLLRRGARMRIPPTLLPLLSPILTHNNTTFLDLVCVPPPSPSAINIALVKVLLRFYKLGKHEDGLTAPQALMVALNSRSYEVLESVVEIWLGTSPEAGPKGKQPPPPPDSTVSEALRCAIRGQDERSLELILRSPLGRASVNEVEKGGGMTPLHIAICEVEDESKSRHLAHILREFGADVNIHAGAHGSPLAAACAKGRFDIARILLEGENPPANLASSLVGRYPTPIQAAIMAGRAGPDTVELLKLLEKRGASPVATGGKYHTPLHAAAIACAPAEVVNWLLRRGPMAPLMRDAFGRLPLHLALCRSREWTRAEEFLHATARAQLLMAKKTGFAAARATRTLASPATSQIVVTHRQLYNRRRRSWEEVGSSRLTQQLLTADIPKQVLALVLSNFKDAQGRSGLHCAVLAPTEDVFIGALGLLRSQDGEISLEQHLASPDMDGWTPLHWACRQPNQATLQVLINDYNPEAEGASTTILGGWTPRRIAIFHGYRNYLDMLPVEHREDAAENEMPALQGRQLEGTACRACLVGLCGEFYECRNDECDFRLCFKCGKHAEILHDMDHVLLHVDLGSVAP